VASFLLLIGFLIVARLFHTSLRYQEWIDSVNLATGVGEETLESVKAWAQQPANFRLLETTYNPQVLDRENMRIEIQAGAAVTMATPCNEMELAFPLAERRLMRQSFKPLQVTVIWHRDRIVLHTLVGDPPHDPRVGNPVVLNVGGANPRARDSQSLMTASLYDTSNNEIPDVFFGWSQEPIDGRGTLENIYRDGTGGQFVHKMMVANGTVDYSPPVGGNPARCRVTAGVIYRGREINQVSGILELAP
jgi:hypothetical protein